MPQLTIQNGPHSGTVFPFDKPIVVGRGRGVDLKIDDPSVSRNHARVDRAAEHWQVSDLGSANGTFVNGRPLSRPTVLHDGDLVAFGGVIAMYRARDGANDTRTTSAVRIIESTAAPSACGIGVAGAGRRGRSLRRASISTRRAASSLVASLF